MKRIISILLVALLTLSIFSACTFPMTNEQENGEAKEEISQKADKEDALSAADGSKPNKSDPAGEEDTESAEDPTVVSSTYTEESNTDFSDNEIIVILPSDSEGHIYSEKDFEDVGCIEFIFLSSCYQGKGQICLLTLAEHSKENVEEKIDYLNQREDVYCAEKNYYFSVASAEQDVLVKDEEPELISDPEVLTEEEALMLISAYYDLFTEKDFEVSIEGITIGEYYGQYEGAYAVVFVSDAFMYSPLMRFVEAGGQPFALADNNPLYLFKNGTFYTLKEADNAGVISQEGFASLYIYHRACNEELYKIADKILGNIKPSE